MSTALLPPSTSTLPAANSPHPTSPTKKRRRRAPATGAAEDCFSCSSLNIKCDRRRPYCGPCLDSNQTCKGYRTQLTWGVGVASRGKLRGMSLPVLNAVTEQQRKDRISKQREEKNQTAEEKAKKQRTSGAGTPNYGQRIHSPPANKLSLITSYDFVNMEAPNSAGTAMSAASRTSSLPLSAPQSAISAPSPRPGLPSHQSHGPHRLDTRSPQSSSAMSSPYSAVSQPRFHSPIPPIPSPQHHHHPREQQHQHYGTPSPGAVSYHKSPYSHVSMPPQQQQSPMLLSPLSEYDNSGYPPAPQHYSTPPQSQPMQPTLSPPMYEMVSGVANQGYPATSGPVTYAGMTSGIPAPAAMHHPQPRVVGHYQEQGMQQHQQHQQQQHHQQQHNGGLQDLLYDEDMLGKF